MADYTNSDYYQIDLVNYCLWRCSGSGVAERVRLTPKTFDVLRYLIEHGGRLLTHDELLGALWRGVYVQPEVLKSHILAVRTALGEKADGGRFIQTERGRGYRFVGSIRVLNDGAAGQQIRAEPSSFAGRADQLGVLHAALRQTVSGQPQAVFISGEPGIGKTALIRRFLAQAVSAPVLAVAMGQCIESFAGAEPYAPVLEALASLSKGPAGTVLVEALLTIAPSWAAQMQAQLPAEQRASLRPQTVEGARGSMVREAGALIDRLAAERPLILILEDLHWADYATIDLLSALCRRCSATNFMLIATYRPEDLRTARHPLNQITRDLAVRNLCREIVLEALSELEITDLLTGGPASERVPADVARRMQAHCSGNPLFLRITLDYLVERGLIGRMGDGWRLLVPSDQLTFDTAPNLTRLIESRIDGLSADQRRALEAASVAGVRFDPASTARAAGLDEQFFENLCEDLFRCNAFLRRDDWLGLPDQDAVPSYTFSHAILRQVLYDQISKARRADLHRAIGDRLEELYEPGARSALAMQLVAHFTAARDWLRALTYLRSALHTATRRLGRRDALTIIDQAAGLIANLPEGARTRAELEFLERRAELLAAGHDRDAHDAYQTLGAQAAACGDIDTQIRALLGLSYVLSWHDLERSLLSLAEVLVLCESLPDPLKQDAARVTAFSRRIWGAGWNRDDARACEDAFVRLRNHDCGITVARAQIAFSLICILSSRYRESHDLVSTGYRLLRESAESHNQADLARAAWMKHVGVPWALLSLGEFGAALAAFEASIAAYRRNGDEAAAKSLTIYRGVLFFHATAYEDVLSTCQPIALELARRHTDGRAEDAQVLPLEQRISLIFCGLAEEALGHPEVALSHFCLAEEQMARRSVHLDWYWRLALDWGLVNAYTAIGDGAAARTRSDRLCDLALQTEERAWQALAWEARARVALLDGKHSDATNAIQKALAACKDVHVPIAEWRVHATASSAFSATQDRRKAETHAQLSMAAKSRLAVTLPHVLSNRLRQFD